MCLCVHTGLFACLYLTQGVDSKFGQGVENLLNSLQVSRIFSPLPAANMLLGL